MDNYQLNQGSALKLTPPLVDSNGNPCTGYTGSETLAAQIWPGGARPVTYAPVPTWVTTSPPVTQLVIPSADSTALAPGRYDLWCFVTPPSSDPYCYYQATLDIIQGPGSQAAATVYTTLDDLLRYGRSWLRQLQTKDDQAGFAEQQGRARSWIEDLAHAHYRVAGMTMVVGSQACGPRRSGARSTYLQDELDANTLMVTDQIREAAAKKALAYICEGQVGTTESSSAYARLGRMYHSQADYLGVCLTLSLDTNSDGFPDITIDCSCTDPLYS
jgi:hypothetical protein